MEFIFICLPALAGLQEQGISETQENPCYVNLLSTETENSPLNATELVLTVKRLATLAVLFNEPEESGINFTFLVPTER